MEADYSWRCTAKGGEITVTSCNKGNSDWEQGKNLSPTGVVKHRNGLSREAVESALGDFQTQLTKSLCNLI